MANGSIFRPGQKPSSATWGTCYKDGNDRGDNVIVVTHAIAAAGRASASILYDILSVCLACGRCGGHLQVMFVVRASCVPFDCMPRVCNVSCICSCEGNETKRSMAQIRSLSLPLLKTTMLPASGPMTTCTQQRIVW